MGLPLFFVLGVTPLFFLYIFTTQQTISFFYNFPLDYLYQFDILYIVTKTKGLTMLLQMIISNELNKRLGREASYAEQRDAYLYIADNCDDDCTFADLLNTMDDFMSDTYFRCDKCGELHPREQMNDIWGAYGHFHTCAKTNCEQEAYYDANNDPYRELRTY